MNRQRIRVIALAALLVAGGAYLWAQYTASSVKPAPTGNAAAKQPAAPTTTKATPAAPATKNADTAKAASKPAAPTSNVPPAKVAGPAPAAASKAAPVPDVKTAAATAAAKPASAPAARPAPQAAAAPAAAPGVLVEPAAWQDQLQKGAYLAETIRSRLPQGTDLIAAAAGFRDLQQFVAAVTASHNLGLNFDELKRRVVTDRKGLGSAIEAMKKVASATIEEQRAEYEARGLIQEAKRHPLPAASSVKPVSTKPQPKKTAATHSGL